MKGGEDLELRVNGEHVTVPVTITTVTELINYFEIKSTAVIVEHNDAILEKTDHSNSKLVDGDRVELVQFVGGG